MRERELKFLMSRGIARSKIIEFDEEGDSKIQNSEFTQTEEVDPYESMRIFLEHKTQIPLIPPHKGLPSSSLEDILE